MNKTISFKKRHGSVCSQPRRPAQVEPAEHYRPPNEASVAPYVGYYARSHAHTPLPNKIGVFKKTKFEYRDGTHDNDPDFAQTIPDIHSPIPFENQVGRDPFCPNGIFGPQILTEGRFVRYENDLITDKCSKYPRLLIPDLEVLGKGDFDDVIGNPSSIKDENAHNQIYTPKFDLVEPNPFRCVPDFNRFKEHPPLLVKHLNVNVQSDPQKVDMGLR